MSFSLQHISDRLEIHDLLVAYCYAIDDHDWDALDDVFTPEAIIDSRPRGGARGDRARTKVFLATALPVSARHQPLIATSKIDLDGDEAAGRTLCYNPLVLDDGTAEKHDMFCGLWYHDRFVRSESGWRISYREQKRGYVHNLPAPEHFPSMSVEPR